MKFKQIPLSYLAEKAWMCTANSLSCHSTATWKLDYDPILVRRRSFHNHLIIIILMLYCGKDRLPRLHAIHINKFAISKGRYVPNLDTISFGNHLPKPHRSSYISHSRLDQSVVRFDISSPILRNVLLRL